MGGWRGEKPLGGGKAHNFLKKIKRNFERIKKRCGGRKGAGQTEDLGAERAGTSSVKEMPLWAVGEGGGHRVIAETGGRTRTIACSYDFCLIQL